ncbi:MAG: hypothetical protein GIKADHBN_03250 [Phycisphaerales bacterium]|nr:hypothetical protein [Phycisphaerales bacterium]
MILTAANLVAAGLGTLAEEVVATLPQATRSHEAVGRLEATIRALPPDRIGSSERVGAAAVNLDALRRLHPAVARVCEDAWGAWESTVEQTECFRAADGNIIQRRGGGRGLQGCLSLADQRGQARQFATEVAPASELMGRPLVVEGLSPPWVFSELMRSTSQGLNGYQRRVMLVQADPSELLDGLSLTDLRELLTQPRVEFHVGADAAASLARTLAGRMDTVLVGRYIPVLATRQRVQPPVDQVLGALEREQQAEHQRLTAEVEARYSGRTVRWWRERFASGGPLRVLIPTCRFSTYVRSSSEDLAEALRAAGHRAQVLMEPDAHSSLASVAYLRELAAFEPDLVVLINYPRAAMGSYFPVPLPYVCWVQDAMPHLFDARLGSAQGDLDFMVGVKLPELVSRFGYKAERCLPMPVVVSDSKFRAAGSQHQSDTVEIVYATHHGETPEAMHERLVRDASKDAVLPRAMEMLEPLAREIAADILAPGTKPRIRAAVTGVLGRIAGGPPPDRAVSVLTNAYVVPMVDRILRHQTASWAAAIARRRGWHLRLCGKNWESHPTLSGYARAALEHGEALRESYASATVHLHASYHGAFHQRVFECVLAGGLPLCRLVWPTISPLLARARAELRGRLGDRFSALASGGAAARCPVDDHPELAEIAAYIESLGLPGLPGWRRGDVCEIAATAPGIGDTEEHTADLVQPAVALSFRDEAELEGLIERAATDAAWRTGSSAAIAAKVREHLTQEVLCRRMIDLVANTSPGKAFDAAESAGRRPTLTSP